MKRLADSEPDSTEVILKKSKESNPSIKAVVLDIEGTTTPITFVHDVLFPYARSNLKSHLEENWEKEETTNDVTALRFDYFIL
jgi:methionine salvage enolase-phosphatase E1